MATNTHPDQWVDTDDRTVATVLAVLADQARAERGEDATDGDT